LRDT